MHYYAMCISLSGTHETNHLQVTCLIILINDQQHHSVLLGQAVVVEEESGPTVSSNSKQGEIQGVKTTIFYQWKCIY